jgi:hypothetical protein
MALRAVDSVSNVWKSLKKYFVDTLYNGESIELNFDKAYYKTLVDDANKVKEWITLALDRIAIPGNIQQAAFRIYLHVREDVEQEELYALTDKVKGYLYDYNMDDGLLRIPLFDTLGKVDSTEWVEAGSMILYVVGESEIYYADDGTKFRWITVLVKWAI